jgi:hypothetical protein
MAGSEWPRSTQHMYDALGSGPGLSLCRRLPPVVLVHCHRVLVTPRAERQQNVLLALLPAASMRPPAAHSGLAVVGAAGGIYAPRSGRAYAAGFAACLAAANRPSTSELRPRLAVGGKRLTLSRLWWYDRRGVQECTYHFKYAHLFPIPPICTADLVAQFFCQRDHAHCHSTANPITLPHLASRLLHRCGSIRTAVCPLRKRGQPIPAYNRI